MTRKPTAPSATPAWIWLPAGFGALLLVVPLVATVVDVPWADLPELLTSDASRQALSLSLRTALGSTALCIALGTPMGWVLARTQFPAQRLIRTVMLLPMVLPPVVSGMALLAAFGRNSLLGGALEGFGIRIGFTTAAVVLAQVFVSLPFMVLGVEGALRTQGVDHERTAATLGAGPGRVLTRVTLPLIAPALRSASVLCFARALGEFGATITFAGSFPGITRTLPLEVYLVRESDMDAAIALSLLLLVVAGVIVAATHAQPRRSV